MIPLDPANAIPIAFAVRIVTTLLSLLTSRRTALARRVALLGSVVASLITGLTAVGVLASGVRIGGELLVHTASRFALSYTVDGLAAWFLLVLACLAAPIAVFNLAYLDHPHLRARSALVGAGFNALVGAVEGVFVAADAVTFLFAWELMTLTNAALVTTEHEDRANRMAAFLYLVMSHVAAGCLIAGFFVTGALAGSLGFATMFSGNVAFGAMRDLVFALFFIGFGTKAGVIPLHIWLPEAHPAAPSSISALMSGVIIKTGIYGIVRVCAFGLGTPRLSWGAFVIVVGGLSAVLGVLYALMQHDIKRLLAYHSIENIGIILLGLGAGMMGVAYGRIDVAVIGVAASLYHTLNHAVFKGLLFLSAGAVVSSTGTRQIEHYGGLLRRMPWTGACFLIGAMAISGLPPLNGFASEWLTFQAFLFGFGSSGEPLVHFLFPVGGAVLALTTALAAACFVKAFGIGFLALPRSEEAAQASESPPLMLAPQAFLAALCVGLGLFPGGVLQVLEGVADSLLPMHRPTELTPNVATMTSGGESFDQVVPLSLAAMLLGVALLTRALARRRTVARRSPTWGCGGELSPRTEYSATAFSKPLMMIFAAIYRPTRSVEALAEVSRYYPREVRYRAEIEPTFERYVYEPLARAVLRVADGMKLLQAGSLNAYLAYVIVMVVSVVLLIWWRG
jgi:hydrogenase-4 component B